METHGTIHLAIHFFKQIIPRHTCGIVFAIMFIMWLVIIFVILLAVMLVIWLVLVNILVYFYLRNLSNVRNTINT